MKKIIVPIDFSASSYNAINYAAYLAKILQADLEIIYFILPESRLWILPLGEPYEETIPISETINHKIQLLKEENLSKGIEANYQTIEGSLIDGILDLVQSEKASLVVIGTNNINNSYHDLIGSNAAKLIGKRKIPVLVIPENYTTYIDSLNPFLLATDFTGIDFLPAFFIELIRKLNVNLEVFHIEDKFDLKDNLPQKEKYMFELKNRFQDVKINFNESFENNVVASIKKFADQHQVQMIAMISHEKGIFDELFVVSATQNMALQTHLPFLAIPDKKTELILEAYW